MYRNNVQYFYCQKWLIFVYAWLFRWTLNLIITLFLYTFTRYVGSIVVMYKLHLYSFLKVWTGDVCILPWLVHQPGKFTNIVHDIIMCLHSLFTCLFVFITKKFFTMVHLRGNGVLCMHIHKHNWYLCISFLNEKLYLQS